MLTRTRRRSARITLVLVGAAALAACNSSNGDDKRDLYASKQDCVRDWGDETKCELAPASAGASTGHSHTGGGYFWGPLYSGSSYRYGSSRTGSSIGSSSIGGARTGSHSIGSSSVSRGGFGSSASSHSSGG